MTKEKALEKLRKLLALAGSQNEHEAALAMEKAGALMKEYGLRTVDVAADGSGAYVVVHEVQTIGPRNSPMWEKILINSVATGFDGKAVYSPSARSYFIFAGKSDMEIILDLFSRLRDSIVREAKNYTTKTRLRYGSCPRERGNSFRIGMSKTIGVRLEALKSRTLPKDQGERSLVVVKDRAVSQKMNRMFPHMRRDRSRYQLDLNGYAAGQEAGRRANLGRSVGAGADAGRIAA